MAEFPAPLLITLTADASRLAEAFGGRSFENRIPVVLDDRRREWRSYVTFDEPIHGEVETPADFIDHDVRRVSAELSALTGALSRFPYLLEQYANAITGGEYDRALLQPDARGQWSFAPERLAAVLTLGIDAVAAEPDLIVFDVVQVRLGSPVRLTTRVRYSLTARSMAGVLAATAPAAPAAPAAPVVAVSAPAAAASAPVGVVLAGAAEGGFWAAVSKAAAVTGNLGFVLAVGVAGKELLDDDLDDRTRQTMATIRLELSQGEAGTLQRCLQEAGYYDRPSLSGVYDGYTRYEVAEFVSDQGLAQGTSPSDPKFIERLLRAARPS